MLEAIAEQAQAQCLFAVDDAEEDCVWFIHMRFKQWGFAERFLATAGRWEAV